MVKFLKSDMTRVKAVCTPPCPWFLFTALNFDKCFQLKQVGPAHTCVREQKGLPLIRSGYLAHKYLNGFRINPTWPIKAFNKTVMKDLSIDFKQHVLRRAKRKCLRLINETDDEQYARLSDYKNELLKRDPHSTVEIELEPGSDAVFRRMYRCLGGLKHGFKQGCRQVVGLDGCHIKNSFKGKRQMPFSPTNKNVSFNKNHLQYQLPQSILFDNKQEESLRNHEAGPASKGKRRMSLSPTNQNVTSSRRHPKSQLPPSTLFDVRHGHSMQSHLATPGTISDH